MLPLSYPREGAQKRKNDRFQYKIALRLKKVCYKVFVFENCQQQSCKAFIVLTIRAKITGGTSPLTWNLGPNRPRWSEIADFRSTFARSAWAITSSDKSSINTAPKQYEIGCQLVLITNRKSHTGFRLIPTSMTLSDLQRRNSPYFAFFFTEFVA